MGKGEGTGSGSGKGALGIVWSIFWFFALIFVGWPVAFFMSWIYIILLPFCACIFPLKFVCEDILLKRFVQLPLTFAENMVAQKALC